MIEKQFWMNAKAAWIVSSSPKTANIPTGPECAADSVLQDNPKESEILFDDIDFDQSVQSMMGGGDLIMKTPPDDKPMEETTIAPPRPTLDVDKFEQAMALRTFPGYTEAAKLLLCCELPKEMDKLYRELISRIPVLQEAVIKFDSVYQADLEEFYDYYIPETLQLTSSYLEYLEAGIETDIVRETEEEIMDAIKKLIIAINDKIDEIYKFASLEIKAKAKALESLMSQDGYVDSKFKLN